MAVVELTKENFEETINGNDFVIVDFWAPWCQPCLQLAPTLEALERAPAGSLVLWENHYGHRVFGDVPLEHLADNDRYQLLFRAYGGEPDTFYVYVFAKVR